MPQQSLEIVTLILSLAAVAYAAVAVRAARQANAIAFRGDWISALKSLRSVHRHLDERRDHAFSRLVEHQKQRDLKSSQTLLDEDMRDRLVSAWSKAEHWIPKELRMHLDASVRSLRELEQFEDEKETTTEFLQRAEHCRGEMRKAIGLAIEILNARVKASAA